MSGDQEGPEHLLALPPGARLHEFEVVSVLGHGGFGITYKAHDVNLDEEVAVKEYLPNDLAVRTQDRTVRPKSRGDSATYDSGLKAFLEEARTIARFRHPNIMQVRRFFEANGTGYIVLGYERGRTLADIAADGPVPAADLERILLAILDGLEAVHDRGILHRDLKPNNVIVRTDGSPVLIDFGAARDFTSRSSKSVTAIAAPGYSPPEQYGSGGQQGPWTDLYALGAIAYRCVTGQTPVDSLRRLRRDPLVPARDAAKGIYPARILRAIDWMLQVQEEDRPNSVGEARGAILGRESESDVRPVEPARLVPLTLAAVSPSSLALAFDAPTRADEIEVTLSSRATGEFLAPGPGGKGAWQSQAHVFMARRSPDGRFLVEGEFLSLPIAGSSVVAASSDGHLRGEANWPDLRSPAVVPPPKKDRTLVYAGAAFLLVAGGAALAAAQLPCDWVGVMCTEAKREQRAVIAQADSCAVAAADDCAREACYAPVVSRFPQMPFALERKLLSERAAASCAASRTARAPAPAQVATASAQVSQRPAEPAPQERPEPQAAEPAPPPVPVAVAPAPAPQPPAPARALPDGSYRGERGYTGPKSNTDQVNCPRLTQFEVRVAGDLISFEGQEQSGRTTYTRYWKGSVDQATGMVALRGSDAEPPTKNVLTIMGDYRNARLESAFCGPGFFRIVR